MEVDIIRLPLNHILFIYNNPDTNLRAQILVVYGWPEDQNKWRTWELVKR